jgi:TRAP-type C4-dicarboxylate transport system permease small subunit
MFKGLKWFVTVPAIIAGVVLVCIMLLTTADVILRFFFNSPITGCAEITQRLIIVAGFLGMGWCALSNMHIKVDLVVGKLPSKAQKVFSAFNYIVVAAVSFIVSTQSYKQASLVKRMHVQSQLLGIPNFPFYYVVSISYFILFLTIIALLVFLISGKELNKEEAE